MIKEHERVKEDESDFLCSNKMIITTKEARKILGKEISSRMSDDDVMRTILVMSNLASNLLNHDSGSKN